MTGRDFSQLLSGKHRGYLVDETVPIPFELVVFSPEIKRVLLNRFDPKTSDVDLLAARAGADRVVDESLPLFLLGPKKRRGEWDAPSLRFKRSSSW